MIRTIIAYGELVLGLPVLVATTIWFVPSLLLAKTIGNLSLILTDSLDAGIEGGISAIFACLVFYWLKVNISLAIPVILAVVTIMWISTRNEMHRALPATAGIIIGYSVFNPVIKIMVG
jgi:hypothetical protein